jgi:hypothetical protein
MSIIMLSSLREFNSIAPTRAINRPLSKGTPEVLPYPILRRLTSPSESRAVPRSAWRRGAPAPGGAALGARGATYRLKFLYVPVCVLSVGQTKFCQHKASHSRRVASAVSLCCAASRPCWEFLKVSLYTSSHVLASAALWDK